MKLLKSILLAGGALLACAAVAQAADLPTKKGAPEPAKPNCYATYWTWLDSSAKDCPLTYWGITFYGQVDVGAGYETNGARLNRYYSNGVQELISNTNHGAKVQLVPNGLSQSNFGLKWKEALNPEWSFIGDVNAGFDPYSFQLVDGPGSLVDNNTLPQYRRSALGDSSRTYGLINTRAFAGVSSKTYGTFTYGRQYAFSNDNDNAYDPFGGAYAFSLIGTSSTLGGGLGDTELARFNNSVKYVYADHGIRAGVLSQVGGWDLGNNAWYAAQGDLGFDWQGFSFDGVYSYARDAVALNVFGPGVLATTLNPNTLKATIQNISAAQLVGKYNWQQFTVYGGWQLAHFTNPDNAALPAFNNVRYFNGGYQALYGQNAGGAGGLGGTGGQGNNNFPVPRDLTVWWTGAKWAVNPYFDLAFGYYHVHQNDYLGITEVTNAGAKNSCAANTSTVASVGGPAGPATLKGTNSGSALATKTPSPAWSTGTRPSASTSTPAPCTRRSPAVSPPASSPTTTSR